MVISIIENLLLPTMVFVISISMIIYLIKKEEKIQLINDKRYEELTNKFIYTIEKISGENNKMIKDLTDSIHEAMVKFDEQKRDK